MFSSKSDTIADKMSMCILCYTLVILSFMALNFSDIVENNVEPVAENAALQGWTVQVEAVLVVLRGVIVKNGQITGNCKRNGKVYKESGFGRCFR